jgi:hypothetical protein
MRLRRKEALVWLGLIIASGFVLSAILSIFAVPLLRFWAPNIMPIAASFFLGLFLVLGVGLLAEERSRGGGGLLIAFALPILWVFAGNAVNFNAGWFGVGCVAGVIGAVYGITQNKYDSLASTARLGYKLFAATILIQISVATILLLNPGTPGAAEIYPAEPATYLVVAVLLFAIMGYLVRRFVHGIRASNVFIFGPSKSGKTLLMLALYKEFITNLRGMKREVIIAEDEEGMRIENLLSDLDGGVLPRSTRQSDLGLYVFSGKKRGISPVSLTIIDYAGEYTADIDEKKYRDAISAISNEINVRVEVLEERIGDPDYLQYLKTEYKSEVMKVLDQVVLAYIYKNLLNSGKVLFLADGDHLTQFHEGGRRELTRICGHYSRIMDLCGADKKYGLVVTKTDTFYQLGDDDGTFKAAEQVELDIYKEWFSEIDTFQEINNRALDMPIYFYATSVFRTRQPINESPGGDGAEPVIPRYIHPWRVDGVVKFGF